jgi:hypothetical protein
MNLVQLLKQSFSPWAALERILGGLAMGCAIVWLLATAGAAGDRWIVYAAVAVTALFSVWYEKSHYGSFSRLANVLDEIAWTLGGLGGSLFLYFILR